MMKTKQDKNVTDRIDVVYVEHKIEHLWSIRLGYDLW